MKKFNKGLIYTIVAISLGVSSSVQATDSKTPSSSFGVLSKATQIELPAKAAELVSKADAKNRQNTTTDVVKAAVGLNPALAPTIVASIAKGNPDMAALAAGTAASLVPDQATEIARVAAIAAPAKSGQIVAAVSRVVPTRYKEIANAVAEATPSQSKEILAALSASFPMIQTSLDKVMASYSGNNLPPVSTVLNQIPANPGSPTAAVTSPTTGDSTPVTSSPVPTTGAVALAGPTYNLPYVNPSVTHINIDPGSGGTVPTGGRGTNNYASP